MTVHYYTIPNCTYEYWDNSHILIAPQGSVRRNLATLQFERRSDGLKIKRLNRLEAYYLQLQQSLGTTEIYINDEVLYGSIPEKVVINKSADEMLVEKLIDYKGIKGCQYKYTHNHILQVTGCTDDEVKLKALGFEQTRDTWVKVLTESELNTIKQYYPNNEVKEIPKLWEYKEDTEENNLCAKGLYIFIGLFCLCPIALLVLASIIAVYMYMRLHGGL